MREAAGLWKSVCGLTITVLVLGVSCLAVGAAEEEESRFKEGAMTHEEMVEMVQELWDREKIKELTYAYGLAIEAQDETQMASLFTENGSVDFSSLGRGVIQGIEALKEFYRSTWPLAVKPFFTNHVIKIQGNKATGICSLENRATRGDQSLIGAGRLHDEYQKIGDEWKFVSRRVEMFYLVPLSEGWATADGLGKL